MRSGILMMPLYLAVAMHEAASSSIESPPADETKKDDLDGLLDEILACADEIGSIAVNCRAGNRRRLEALAQKMNKAASDRLAVAVEG